MTDNFQNKYNIKKEDHNIYSSRYTWRIGTHNKYNSNTQYDQKTLHILFNILAVVSFYLHRFIIKLGFHIYIVVYSPKSPKL